MFSQLLITTNSVTDSLPCVTSCAKEQQGKCTIDIHHRRSSAKQTKHVSSLQYSCNGNQLQMRPTLPEPVDDQVQPEMTGSILRLDAFYLLPSWTRKKKRRRVLASFVDGPVIGRPSFCLATSAGLFLFWYTQHRRTRRLTLTPALVAPDRPSGQQADGTT